MKSNEYAWLIGGFRKDLNLSMNFAKPAGCKPWVIGSPRQTFVADRLKPPENLPIYRICGAGWAATNKPDGRQLVQDVS